MWGSLLCCALSGCATALLGAWLAPVVMPRRPSPPLPDVGHALLSPWQSTDPVPVSARVVNEVMVWGSILASVCLWRWQDWRLAAELLNVHAGFFWFKLLCGAVTALPGTEPPLKHRHSWEAGYTGGLMPSGHSFAAMLYSLASGSWWAVILAAAQGLVCIGTRRHYTVDVLVAWGLAWCMVPEWIWR